MSQLFRVIKVCLWFIAVFGTLDFVLAEVPGASPRLAAWAPELAWTPILGVVLLADALGVFRRMFR